MLLRGRYMSDEKDALEVGDIVRVKGSPTISALIANPLGVPLDGRIGEIESIAPYGGGAIYEVRLWWYAANFKLFRSQIEYLPGTRDDWFEEAMKHISPDNYFVRTPPTPSDGDPLS